MLQAFDALKTVYDRVHRDGVLNDPGVEYFYGVSTTKCEIDGFVNTPNLTARKMSQQSKSLAQDLLEISSLVRENCSRLSTHEKDPVAPL